MTFGIQASNTAAEDITVDEQRQPEITPHHSGRKKMFAGANDNEQTRKCTDRISARYILSSMLFYCYFLIYATRFNLSMALVAMVTKNITVMNITKHGECLDSNLSSIAASNEPNESWQNGEFDWDQRTQGIILSSFFYGYIVTQIPGGRMAEIFGPKIMIFLSIFVSGLGSLLTPPAARGSLPALITLRAVMGLAQGPVYPSAYLLYARWWPCQQRSLMISLCVLGSSISQITTPLFTAMLCKYGFSGGWPSAFYVPGIITLPWCGLWIWLVHDYPEFHSRIAGNELRYILENRDMPRQSGKRSKVPWKHMLTSMPVWSLAIKDFCNSAGGYALATKLPSYMDTVHGVSIAKNGLLNSGIYAASVVSPVASASLADLIIRKKWLRKTTTRKIFGGIADISMIICLGLVPAAGCNTYFVLAMLICASSIRRFDNAGLMPIIVEVGPRFTGTIKGLVNFASNLQGIITPMVISEFIQNDVSLASWSRAFYFSASFPIFGVLVFLIFASAEPQSWSLEDDDAVPSNTEKKPTTDVNKAKELVNLIEIKDIHK